MQVISIPSKTVYSNLYTLAGYTNSRSLIVTNNSTSPLYIIQQLTLPAPSSRGYTISPGETTLIQANTLPIWIRGGAGPILVQAITEVRTSPFAAVDLPQDIYTSTTERFRRLRVDVAQTSFFEGREFRTFKEWPVATTGGYVIQVVVPVNIILFSLGIQLEAGEARIETVVGGTPAGIFDEVLPKIAANTMSEVPTPAPTSQVLLTAGGTHTGGVVIDVLRAKTSGNSNFAQSVGGSITDERGVGLNTYYFRITLTEAIGVFKARWEERP